MLYIFHLYQAQDFAPALFFWMSARVLDSNGYPQHDFLIDTHIIWAPPRENQSSGVSTKIGLNSHRRWLEAWNFGFRKKRDCTICVAKTKVLISCAVTVKLICVFVFIYAKRRFSHEEAHMISWRSNENFPFMI